MRRLDRVYCETQDGDTGPVERKLRTFGPVRALVFGAWGEAPADTEVLLITLAARGSLRHRAAMRANDMDQARGALAWLLRRRWGIAAVRA